jgi:transcriptional regulator with XRE-family HTH domain
MLLSQGSLADKTGGELNQAYIARIEAGRNKATSWKVRSGLAKAFNLTVSELDDYLEGRLTLRDALHRARHPREDPVTPPWPGDSAPFDAQLAAADKHLGINEREAKIPALDKGLALAFDATRHELSDLDAVRLALRHHRAFEGPEFVAQLARRWLDVAADARLDEEYGLDELTLERLLIRTTEDLETRIRFLKLQLEHARIRPVEIGHRVETRECLCEWNTEQLGELLGYLATIPGEDVDSVLADLPTINGLLAQPVELPFAKRLELARRASKETRIENTQKVKRIAADNAPKPDDDDIPF